MTTDRKRHTLYDMRVKVSKHGNSLGFNVPAQAAALEVGREYELKVEESGALIFKPLRRRTKLTIDELLEGLPTDGSLHYDEPWENAPLVGKEKEWL